MIINMVFKQIGKNIVEFFKTGLWAKKKLNELDKLYNHVSNENI